MNDTANQFATDYMQLCTAAHHYAPFKGITAVNRQEAIRAEDTYHLSLQVCLESAQKAFPGRGRLNLFLAISKALDEAKTNDKPLAEFKAESFKRVTQEIDAMPQQTIGSVRATQKLGAGVKPEGEIKL